ncbi:MAG: hypothetical protein HY873_09210 [Chloroflexi bacterium]|nr:hypothetical protein [Chloroflexota bacterium]
MGTSVALVVRLALPLTIIRWPLAGGLLAIAADTIDILIFNALGFPEMGYQRFDKLLDLYYLALELVVVQRWAPFERIVASALFAWRLAGVVLFEAIGARSALLLFPNMFEVHYLLVLAARRWAPGYELTPARTGVALAILLVPKLAQEYALHYARWLDNLVAFEVISDVARWIGDRLQLRGANG